jgi:hypothetical protein
LTVLEQNTSGLEGWWLCMLRGRQVIIHISLINIYESYTYSLQFADCKTKRDLQTIK